MTSLHVQTEQYRGEILLKPGETIAEALERIGIRVPTPCGGNGTCGKCRVCSDGEWVKACRTVPVKDTHITELGWEPGGAQDMTILTAERVETGHSGKGILAVDIGTTTLAAALVDADTGAVLDTAGAVNHQNRYGADVLSRIRAANADEADRKAMQQAVRTDVRRLWEELAAKHPECVPEEIYLAGNTTMEHLFMGDSCESLGKAPFLPVSLAERHTQLEGIPVTLLPGISAFVGADIAAGMLACELDQRKKPALLLDIGTNGEMALATEDGFYVTSAPAGPAFEGGNISCGMPGMPGAICKVRIAGTRSICRVIGGTEAVGICGTGVLELVAELLDHRLVDSRGCMAETYAVEGYPLVSTKGGRILFTQEDLRQVQMAKAAICSGVRILLKKAGISETELTGVFLAGGFGYYMDVQKAVRVGILPKGLEKKTKATGNTSLQGCIRYATDRNAPLRMRRMIEASREINLANEPDFEVEYIANMDF
ncbi:MAG: DUF4445 domain-containing protein [Lachnospiraceae bacterium]|nr:DUF4445 domain-containing protein [Lachnospiraceae bacterium]